MLLSRSKHALEPQIRSRYTRPHKTPWASIVARAPQLSRALPASGRVCCSEIFRAPPSGGGAVQVHGVAELLEASNEATFGGGAIAFVEVRGAEVNVWA